jgi:hypothetical protein
MFKLVSSLTEYLLNQPESGMGYQIVEATFVDKKTAGGIAYNGELLLLAHETRLAALSGTYESVLESAGSSAGQIASLRVVTRPPVRALAASVHESAAAYGRKSGPAKDAPEEKTTLGEIFKRFSAYRNDRRVLPDSSLRPGTYATTEADARNVKTGTDAVRRYALPDPKPASFVFAIAPLKDTVIQYGSVQPAYGQPGGGVEVIFTNGTDPKTVAGPTTIPDK